MNIRIVFALAVCLTVSGFASEDLLAQTRGPDNLFAQYYTQPGASQVAAEMYPAPHPVPNHVGNSYYTYQPLMPHEMMYAHKRDYYRYYAGPDSFYCNQCGGGTYRGGYGVTKTSVRWQHGCHHIAPLPGVSLPFSRVGYWFNRRYTVPQGPLAHFSFGSRLMRHLGDGGIEGAGSEGCQCGDEFGGACPWGDCHNESYAHQWSHARQAATARAVTSMNDRMYR